MKGFRDKRGQISVLAMMIMSTMVFMIWAFIIIFRSIAVDSSVKSMGRVWAQSILGEYDTNLYKRFGLLGYYGNANEVDEKLNYMAAYSLDGKSYISWEGCSSGSFGYSLENREEFLKQVRESYGEGLFDGGRWNGWREGKAIEEISEVAITNRRIIYGLPSSVGTDDSILDNIGEFLKSLGGIRNAVTVGTNGYMETAYIRSHFGNALSARDEAFLKYEGEYVICGKKSDRDNYYGVRNRIIAIREILNFAYINSNARMRDEALLIAEVIAPGPGAPAVQQALIGAWALAESINDYRLLVNGRKVPFMKDDSSWAMDLESIIANQTSGYVYTGNERGETYGDYLFTMIFLLGENTRLLRMMDLIEIDMKNNCYKDFKLADYYAGIDYRITVNGREYNFGDSY